MHQKLNVGQYEARESLHKLQPLEKLIDMTDSDRYENVDC
jgi:hypothetical protein